MNWAAWTYIILSLLTLYGSLVMHGKPRPDYNAGKGLLNFIIAFGLLWFAGFFK